MKTKEELRAIKEEVENVNKRLAELTEEELKQVIGGVNAGARSETTIHPNDSEFWYSWNPAFIYDEKRDDPLQIGHGKNGKPTLVLNEALNRNGENE